jgi:hypothetical protein
VCLTLFYAEVGGLLMVISVNQTQAAAGTIVTRYFFFGNSTERILSKFVAESIFIQFVDFSLPLWYIYGNVTKGVIP